MLRPLHSVCRRSMLALAAGVLIATFVPAAAAQDSVPLKYKWTKGQVIVQRMTNETTTDGTTPMGPMKSSQKQVSVMRTTVQSVGEDGTATLEMVTESIKIDNDIPMQGKMTYDSTKPQEGDADNPGLTAMTAMLNMPITLTIRPDGTVTSVKGSEKILEKVRKSMADQPGAERMLPELDKMFNEEGMKKLVGQGMSNLPGRDTKTGETWQQTMNIELPMMGTVRSTIDYTLAGVEKLSGTSAAKIGIKSVQALVPPKEGEAPAMPMPGMKMDMKDAVGTGEMWFDFNRGLVLKQVLDQNMTMDISIDAGGQDMKMSQKVNTKTTFEMLDADTTKPAAATPVAPAAAQ